jgi:hypothetical protein
LRYHAFSAFPFHCFISISSERRPSNLPRSAFRIAENKQAVNEKWKELWYIFSKMEGRNRP